MLANQFQIFIVEMLFLARTRAFLFATALGALLDLFIVVIDKSLANLISRKLHYRPFLMSVKSFHLRHEQHPHRHLHPRLEES